MRKFNCYLYHLMHDRSIVDDLDSVGFDVDHTARVTVSELDNEHCEWLVTYDEHHAVITLSSGQIRSLEIRLGHMDVRHDDLTARPALGRPKRLAQQVDAFLAGLFEDVDDIGEHIVEDAAMDVVEAVETPDAGRALAAECLSSDIKDHFNDPERHDMDHIIREVLSLAALDDGITSDCMLYLEGVVVDDTSSNSEAAFMTESGHHCTVRLETGDGFFCPSEWKWQMSISEIRGRVHVETVHTVDDVQALVDRLNNMA